MKPSGSTGRVLAALLNGQWKKVKDSNDIRGLILTSSIAGLLSFVRRTGPLGLSLFDQIVPALVEVLFNFPHTN
jgi:hypothetical protein